MDRADVTPQSREWYSHVRTAETVRDADHETWDEVADLVIVGFGGAGAAAAVEAAQLGISVIALDKYEGGGSTAMNGGIYYAGGGTSIQTAAGVEDSPEEMYNYLRLETQGVVRDETLRRFCESSVGTFDWLVRCGVAFHPSLYPKKTSYPWKDFYLYHPDNSLVPSYAAAAKPAARGHKGYMDLGAAAQGFGVAIFNPLRDTAQALGVKVLRQSEAQNLIVDEGGRVVGVRIRQVPPDHALSPQHKTFTTRATKYQLMVPPALPGAGITIGIGKYWRKKAEALEKKIGVERRIRARYGVLLSCGGFVQNRKMVEYYAPRYKDGMPNGSPGDDGSGIRLGQTVGAATARMNYVSAWRLLNPPHSWVQGILVNAKGERYVNETLYAASIGYAMVEEQDGVGYLVIDRAMARDAWRQIRSKDPMERMLPFQRDSTILAMLFQKKTAPTIAGLAGKLKIDPLRLGQTVDAYNTAIKTGGRDPLGKGPDDRKPILEPPFYGIDISITARLFPLPMITMGGLAVDEDSGQVLAKEGSVVPGLYAAGRTAVGVCSNIYVSGLSAADCIFSGRRAATHVASLAHNRAE